MKVKWSSDGKITVVGGKEAKLDREAVGGQSGVNGVNWIILLS